MSTKRTDPNDFLASPVLSHLTGGAFFWASA